MLNQKLIKQLSKGEIQVKNDGNVEQLQEILHTAFPLDASFVFASGNYYSKYDSNYWGLQLRPADNIPIVSVKDFFKEDFVLPEKWCIRGVERGSNQLLLRKYFDRFNNVWECDSPTSWYFIENNNHVQCEYCIPKGYTKITFEQFKEHVLNNSMRKEIIGYKCPMDIFGGNIKKGTLYKRVCDTETYSAFTGGGFRSAQYNLPKEIVETWEPVYEEQEKIISVGGQFDVKITPEGIFHKSSNITQFVQDLNFFFKTEKKESCGRFGYVISDVIFSSTGCEHKETKLSDWKKVWEEYQNLKNA